MLPMLDERARLLLKALIERHIADGQPVGSRSLSRISGLDLSPATIRNVMSDLEEMGFLASAHTSAGRVPTPRGYRLFVDTLLTVQPMREQQAQIIQGQLSMSDPNRAILGAAQMLSNLSQFAGVVLTPRRSSSFRQVEFLRLSDKRVLLIIVTPEGDVQNRILVTEVHGKLVGLIVDSASEVLKIPESDIELPPVFDQGELNYVTGVGKLNGRLIILIDLNRILQKGELRRVGEASEPRAVAAFAGL